MSCVLRGTVHISLLFFLLLVLLKSCLQVYGDVSGRTSPVLLYIIFLYRHSARHQCMWSMELGGFVHLGTELGSWSRYRLHLIGARDDLLLVFRSGQLQPLLFTNCTLVYFLYTVRLEIERASEAFYVIFTN